MCDTAYALVKVVLGFECILRYETGRQRASNTDAASVAEAKRYLAHLDEMCKEGLRYHR